MKAGPLQYATAYELPPGIDAEVHLYFVSDSTDGACRVTLSGVTEFTYAEPMLAEVKKLMASVGFVEKAQDWRLMTRAEVTEYRKQQQQEAERAHKDNQAG